MLLVCLIWGVNFSVTKLAIGQIPPLPFTAIRLALASLLLWMVLRLTEEPAVLPPSEIRRLVVLGVVGNTCYQLLFILGLAHTSATNSSLILSMVPTVVAVFAGLLGLERVTPKMWLGIGLGTLGVVLVIAASGMKFSTGTLTGDLLTVAAVLCWAGYTVGLHAAPGDHGDDDRRHARPGPRRTAGAARPAMGHRGPRGVVGAGVRDGALAGGGVSPVEPERPGGGRHADGHLHVHHPARRRGRGLGGPRRARPAAAGDRGRAHHRGSVADEGVAVSHPERSEGGMIQGMSPSLRSG